MITVELTTGDLRQVEQHINALFAAKATSGLSVTKFRPTTGTIWDAYRRGYGAEVAVARWLDRPWKPLISKVRYSSEAIPPDVEPDIEVRSTQNAANPILHVGMKDVLSRRFVLCLTDDGAVVHLLGWIWGDEAHALGPLMKREREDSAELYEAWAVPTDRLRGIYTFNKR